MRRPGRASAGVRRRRPAALVSTDRIGQPARPAHAGRGARRPVAGRRRPRRSTRRAAGGRAGNPRTGASPSTGGHRGRSSRPSGLRWTALRNGTYAETLLLVGPPGRSPPGCTPSKQRRRGHRLAVPAGRAGGGDRTRSSSAPRRPGPGARAHRPGAGPRQPTSPRYLEPGSPARRRSRLTSTPDPDEIIEAGDDARAGLLAETIAMALGFGRAAREGYLGVVTDDRGAQDVGRPADRAARSTLARHRETAHRLRRGSRKTATGNPRTGSDRSRARNTGATLAKHGAPKISDHAAHSAARTGGVEVLDTGDTAWVLTSCRARAADDARPGVLLRRHGPHARAS